MGRFGTVASLLPLIASLAGAASIPRDLQPAPVTRARLSAAQVQRELGRHLSATTSIFGPSDDRYTNATERWNTFAVPHIQVVIEPGQERDVSIIVSRASGARHPRGGFGKWTRARTDENPRSDIATTTASSS